MKVKNPALSYKSLVIGALYLVGILAAGFDITSASAQVSHSVSASGVVALTNATRARAGVDALRVNSTLNRSAQMKANDMAEKSYFAHANSDGQRVAYWLAVAGYGYRSAGENLAKGYFSSEAVVNAWVASSSHYANMVNSNYHEIGIGIAPGFYNGNPTVYVVQHFGQPRALQPIASQPAEAAPAPAPQVTQPHPAPAPTPKAVATTPTPAPAPIAVAQEEGSAMPQIMDFLMPTALAYEDSALRFDILNSSNQTIALQAIEPEAGESAPTAASSAARVLLALVLAAWLVGSLMEMYIPQTALVVKLFVQRVQLRFLEVAKPVL